MDAVSIRSVATVAVIQVSVVFAALFNSSSAAVAAAVIGALALGRYFSIALFATSMGSVAPGRLRFFAASAWILGFLALVAAVAAVALRARAALPWAVAAAFVGPIGMSVQAFGSGLGAIAAGRRVSAERRDAARSGGDR